VQKKFVVIPFGVINFAKLNYFIFEMLKKKSWANFQRIIELFTQKFDSKLSKIWVWDRGSGIQKKPIPDPGSRGQKGTRSRIPDPQHCQNLIISLLNKETSITPEREYSACKQTRYLTTNSQQFFLFGIITF
jgi:hypothetical protein